MRDSSRAPITERQLRPVAAVIDWRKQRRMWKRLLAEQQLDIVSAGHD